MEKHQSGSRGRRSEGKICTRAIVVVSTGSNGQGRVDKLRIGLFE